MLNLNYIGIEHILLALIREGEGVAVQVIQLLSGYQGKEPATSPLPHRFHNQ